MKRWTKRIAIVAALLAAVWFGYVRFVVIRMKQNNASVAMLVATSRIEQHLQEKSAWPTSWDDLPLGDRAEFAKHWVVVNWQPSMDEVNPVFERVNMAERDRTNPPDYDLPFLVRYSDRVPRDISLERSERLWNWLLLQAIYENLAKK